MKKEMNGKSRRKWVVGGAMVFGSIALLSTGFATWVIGAINNSADAELDVAIDTVSNDSITVTAKATDAKILIADENTTDFDTSTDLVRVKDSERDLQFTVKLTAVYSKGYGTLGDVQAEFKNNSNMIAKKTIDDLHTDIVSPLWNSGRSGETVDGIEYYSVFGTVTENGTSDWSVPTDNGQGAYTATRTITYDLGIGGIWGTDKSFAKYVSNLYSAVTVTGRDATLYGEVETEMNQEIEAIKKALVTDNKLTVKLTVNKK